MDFVFFANAVLFGVGLAMDAFSVSLVNGFSEPDMKRSMRVATSGVFAGFQFAMPFIGWLCVRYVESVFSLFSRFIPWIALILLCFIGGKMLIEGIRSRNSGAEEKPALTVPALLLQGVATSIDALSVGFTTASFSWLQALVESAVIGVVTFAICVGGLFLGRKFGSKFSGSAYILGGIILLCIGIRVFVSGLSGG